MQGAFQPRTPACEMAMNENEREELLNYVYGRMTAGERAAYERKLETEDALRGEFRRERGLNGILDKSGELAPLNDATERMWSAINAAPELEVLEGGVEGPSRGRPWWAKYWPVEVGAAIAAAVLVGVLLYVPRDPANPGDPGTPPVISANETDVPTTDEVDLAPPVNDPFFGKVVDVVQKQAAATLVLPDAAEKTKIEKLDDWIELVSKLEF
jgi:hypothetical protein